MSCPPCWHCGILGLGLVLVLPALPFIELFSSKQSCSWLALATHFLMWASSLVAVFRICGFVLLFPILNVTHDGHHFLLRILYYSLRGGVGEK